MKKSEIKVGGHYLAKVSGVVTTVRVDRIRDRDGFKRTETVYDVTNLRTGRTTTFRSAAKFRGLAKKDGSGPAHSRLGTGYYTDAQEQQISDAIDRRDAEEAAADPTTAGTGTATPPVAPPASGSSGPSSPPSERRMIEVDFPPGSDEGVILSDEPAPEGEQRPDPTSAPSALTAGSADPTTTPSGAGSTLSPVNGRLFTPPPGLRGDQPAAYRVITARVDRGERVTKLCGYAGSGKTYLVAELAKWALANNYRTTVVAPTHKAAGVIEEKLGNAGVPVGAGEDDGTVDVRTIHSLLGLTLAPDYENDTGGRILVDGGGGKTKLRGGLVICDEASMVGEVLKGHIDRSPSSVRWLFVGDLAQLPPVGEGVSELLDDPDATLETVLRQGEGSEILSLATRVRRGDLDLEYAPGKDVSHVDDAEALFQAALRRFDTPEYRADPAHARVLVFRNARRTGINARMRSLLVPDAPGPYTPGEWLVMYAAFSPEKSRLNVLCEAARKIPKGDYGYGRAWKRFFDAKRATEGQAVPQLHVSQEVRVVAAEDGDLTIGAWTFGVHRLTVHDRDGGAHVLPVLRAEEVARHRGVMDEQVAAAQELRRRRDEHPEFSPAWADLDKRRKQAWGVFYSLEETFAQVDYAYAMTVHKSQGSTFDHAFVDVPDLMSSGGMQQRILYTALTRPSKSLTFYA